MIIKKVYCCFSLKKPWGFQYQTLHLSIYKFNGLIVLTALPPGMPHCPGYFLLTLQSKQKYFKSICFLLACEAPVRGAGHSAEC